MKNILLILFFSFLNLSLIYAQRSAVIYGTITDKSSSTTLPAATIVIDGTAIGTITDKEGKYRLMGVPTGEQIIAVSFIGFNKYTQKVTIKPGDNIELNVVLEISSTDIDEVIVTAQMAGQASAINQQLKSDALVNVVSSDKMRELPDINAAEAIGRLPGVSINRSGGEAQTINIRGFGSSYTAVTLNGIKMAETGSGNRTVNLSNISPDLLSHIEVYKSPTADMDGDAVGGTVSLGLMPAKNKPISEITLSSGYSTLKKAPSYKGNVRLSRRFWDNKFGAILNTSFDITDRSTQRMNTSYQSFLQDDNNDPIGYLVEPSNDLGLADIENTIGRFGINLQADYQYDNGSVKLQGMYNLKNSNTFRQSYSYDGLSTNVYTLGINESKVNLFQTMISAEHNLSWLEIDGTVGVNRTTNRTPYSPAMSFSDPYAYDISINSVSTFPKITDKFDYLTHDYSDATMARMEWDVDSALNSSISAVLNFKTNFQINSNIAGFIKFGGKTQFDSREKTNDPFFQRYDSSSEQAYATEIWKEITGNDLLVAANEKILIQNFNVQDKSSPFWNGDYSVWPRFSENTIRTWYDNMKNENRPEVDEQHQNYSVNEKLYAAYVMAKLNVGKWLSFVPGIRYEYSDNYYQGQWSSLAGSGTNLSGSLIDTSTTKQYGHFLPSAHLKITPVYWMDFRLSYAKTLKRPNYSEIVPTTRVDVSNGFLKDMGNGNLNEMIANSYDASVSFYSNMLGLISFGVFSKQFTNYITEVSYTMPPWDAVEMGLTETPWEVRDIHVNLPDQGYVKGFEVDIQTNFKYLPKPFNGLILNYNVTRLWSKTYLEKWEQVEYYDLALRRVVIDWDNSYFYKEESQLSSQVNLVMNATLGYEYKGFSCRVSGQYQGIDLIGVVNSKETELSQQYNEDWVRVDLAIAQKIGKHIRLRFNIANLTDTPEKEYIYQAQYWRSESRYGAVYQFGFEYNF